MTKQVKQSKCVRFIFLNSMHAGHNKAWQSEENQVAEDLSIALE